MGKDIVVSAVRMLLGSPFLTVAIVNLLAYRQYFNRQRQLVLGPGN